MRQGNKYADLLWSWFETEGSLLLVPHTAASSDIYFVQARQLDNQKIDIGAFEDCGSSF